jgi:hypothetical protein
MLNFQGFTNIYLLGFYLRDKMMNFGYKFGVELKLSVKTEFFVGNVSVDAS